MKKYTRKAVFSELKKYDALAEEHDSIEVTEWKNGDGFDVEINGKLPITFGMTWGSFQGLKKLVKTLDNDD